MFSMHRPNLYTFIYMLVIALLGWGTWKHKLCSDKLHQVKYAMLCQLINPYIYTNT